MRTLLLASLTALVASTSAQTPKAYLVDSNLDQLFSVNLTTGAATLIGSTAGTGLDTPAGLAWRTDTHTLWTIDLGGGEVGTLNVSTGAFSTVFVANPTTGWQGIDWDPTTGRFYLLNQTNNVYALDPATGITTLLGSTGATMTGALDSDASGVLWACNFSPASLYQINKTTGAATLIAPTMPAGVQGMAFAPDGRLYFANSNDDSLYTVNPMTGATTLVGPHGGGVQFAKGFEIVTGPCSGAFAPFGSGCADFSSAVVRMLFGGTPCLAQNAMIGATAGAQTPVIALSLGASNTAWGSLPLPFSLASLGNPGCTVYMSHDVSLGVLPVNFQLPIAIPNNLALVDVQVHFQATVLDARLPGLGVALSNLLSMTIGR